MCYSDHACNMCKQQGMTVIVIINDCQGQGSYSISYQDIMTYMYSCREKKIATLQYSKYSQDIHSYNTPDLDFKRYPGRRKFNYNLQMYMSMSMYCTPLDICGLDTGS